MRAGNKQLRREEGGGGRMSVGVVGGWYRASKVALFLEGGNFGGKFFQSAKKKLSDKR